MQALDDGGGVDEVSTAESTQQVFVDVVDATPSSSKHLLLTRHATRRGCSRLVADGSGRLHHAQRGLGPPYNTQSDVYAATSNTTD